MLCTVAHLWLRVFSAIIQHAIRFSVSTSLHPGFPFQSAPSAAPEAPVLEVTAALKSATSATAGSKDAAAKKEAKAAPAAKPEKKFTIPPREKGVKVLLVIGEAFSSRESGRDSSSFAFVRFQLQLAASLQKCQAVQR